MIKTTKEAKQVQEAKPVVKLPYNSQHIEDLLWNDYDLSVNKDGDILLSGDKPHLFITEYTVSGLYNSAIIEDVIRADISG